MPTEQQEESTEKVNYFSGELTLYIKGQKRAYNIFASKSEMKAIMEEWHIEYQFVEGVEIGIIFE